MNLYALQFSVQIIHYQTFFLVFRYASIVQRVYSIYKLLFHIYFYFNLFNLDMFLCNLEKDIDHIVINLDSLTHLDYYKMCLLNVLYLFVTFIDACTHASMVFIHPSHQALQDMPIQQTRQIFASFLPFVWYFLPRSKLKHAVIQLALTFTQKGEFDCTKVCILLKIIIIHQFFYHFCQVSLQPFRLFLATEKRYDYSVYLDCS